MQRLPPDARGGPRDRTRRTGCRGCCCTVRRSAYRVLSVAPDFDPAALPGQASVRRSLRHVGAVVITVPAGRAEELAAVPGVRGISPDAAMQVTSDASSWSATSWSSAAWPSVGR